MVIGHVVPREEAVVRALNGDKIYGCLSDCDMVWYADLSDRALLDEYVAILDGNGEWEGAYFLDSLEFISEGDRVDFGVGKYLFMSHEEEWIEKVETPERLREVYACC